MDYEWDEAKAAQNALNHGVAFIRVHEFEWLTAHVVPDNRRDYGEPRFVATGLIGGRLHVLAFTARRGCVRVISLRKANQRERRRYERKRA